MQDYFKAIEYIKLSNGVIYSGLNRPGVNVTHLIRNYFILSLFYGAINRIPEKMNAIDSCITLSMNFKKVDNRTLYPLLDRAEYFYETGEYTRAIDLATIGENLIKQFLRAKDSIGYMMSISGTKINSLLRTFEFAQAERIATNAVLDYKKLKLDEDPDPKLNKYLGMLYEQLAEAYMGRGNFKQAENYFNLAYEWNFKAGKLLECAQNLTNEAYGLYYKGYRNFPKAISEFKRALRILQAGNNTSDWALEAFNIYGNIANVFVEQEQYDSAFKYYKYAFDQLKPGISEDEILQSSLLDEQYKSSRFLIKLMIERGNTHIRRYHSIGDSADLQKAISIYTFTDKLLDRIKSRQYDLQSKLFWRADNRRLYENAINACYLAGKPEKGFYFFEKSRAVLLNDQLNEQFFLKENEILTQSQERRQILYMQRRLDTLSVTSSDYTITQNDLFLAKQKLNDYLNHLKTSNALYFQSFYDSSFLSIGDVRTQILNEYPALLELFVGDTAVYVLVISQEKMYFNRINKSDFERAVNSFSRHLTDQSLLNHDFQGFITASTELYKLIFQNINLPTGRIIISPDGPYFPFEALVVQMREGRPVYFLEDHAVSYTYSARYLMNSFTNSTTDSRPLFLGVAPVKYGIETRLASLDGSDHSLQRIGRHFSDVDKMIGSDASRNNFLNRYFNYKIIQLYAHASDSSIRGEPVIWLADSVLYLSDLIGGNKPITRLIVLSACETGSGKLYQGEGVFSFNRGFAAIGIPSAITNLWSVDSKSTYELTELFYKFLSEGNPTDIALQKGKTGIHKKQ
jgi:CHAT domain-containing protein